MTLQNRGGATVTIPEALEAVARSGRGELTFHLDDGRVRLSAGELAERSAAASGFLAGRGIGPGDRVGLLGPNRPEWAIWAYAVWMAGAALVPVQIPIRVRDRSAFEARVAALIRTAGCAITIADPALAFAVPGGLAHPWDESPSISASPLPAPSPEDPAVIQFTSGSTADPKGAVLPHSAVLAQVDAIAQWVGPDPADEVILGWVPFFHDLGLFLHLVMPVLFGGSGHVLPTERFAREPLDWLRLGGETEASLMVGPQSAWSATFAAARRHPEEKLDLGSVEAALFGAEGIDPAFVDRMVEMGEPVGLRPGALGGTYGLAEAVMGVTSTLRGDGIRAHAVDRAVLAREGRAVSPQERTQRVASSGPPVPGMAVRITDARTVLPECVVGEIQVQGPSLMTGYYGDEGAGPFTDGWLRTGDLGYLRDGELYVTGRAKDILIVMGHNYHPEDFEWAASRVAGVRPGRCAAFLDADRERLVLLVEPSADAPGRLAETVRNAVGDAVGTRPGEVAVVAPGTIEKTTSGKLRRGAMRAAYEGGELQVMERT